MRKAALHNLGCKVNAYETEAMEQLLEAAGYEIVSFEEKADVYVINTCSVTNVADKKSRQMLHRAKAKNPDAVVVAAGSPSRTLRDPTSTRNFTSTNRRSTPAPSSRFRTAATSSAATASFRIREAASEAAGRRMWRRK